MSNSGLHGPGRNTYKKQNWLHSKADKRGSDKQIKRRAQEPNSEYNIPIYKKLDLGVTLILGGLKARKKIKVSRESNTKNIIKQKQKSPLSLVGRVPCLQGVLKWSTHPITFFLLQHYTAQTKPISFSSPIKCLAFSTFSCLFLICITSFLLSSWGNTSLCPLSNSGKWGGYTR